MQKILSIIVLLFLTVIWTQGAAQSKNNTPLLIRTSPNLKLDKLEIVTSCVKDTTNIAVSVSVRFNENFSDSVELNTPEEIYVLGFSYLDGNPSKKKDRTNQSKVIFEDFEYTESASPFADGIKSNQENPQDICIRKVCDAQFKMWLKKQPYSNMYDIKRFYGYNGFTLTFPVLLIPVHYKE